MSNVAHMVQKSPYSHNYKFQYPIFYNLVEHKQEFSMEPQPMLIIIRHSICTCFLVEYQQYFDRFSRDGLLDKQGFRSVLQCLEIDPPQCVVDEMFAEHDKDGRFCR